MSHLEERLSAFVDGELGHSDRERVLSHLAGCETCRFEAEMLRRIKQRLCALGTPEPAPDFLGRLLSPPGDTFPGGPPNSGGFGTTPPLGSGRPLGGAPARLAEPRTAPPRGLSRFRPEWGRARYAVAGVSIVAVTLGTAFVAGGERAEQPVVTPALTDYAIEHAAVSGQTPLGDPVTVPVVAPPSPQGATVRGVQPVNSEAARPDTSSHR